MNAAAKQTAPTNAAREHWSRETLSTCLRWAEFHRIIKPSQRQADDTDLHVLPPAIHDIVFAKCQELIAEACRKEIGGNAHPDINQWINGELWDFLKTWRPRGLEGKCLAEEL